MFTISAALETAALAQAREAVGAIVRGAGEACSVLGALAHLADVMLGVEFEAELGHEIEPGLGGLLIGITENLAGGYLGSAMKEVAGFAMIIVVLMIRPFGIFGERDIERV